MRAGIAKAISVEMPAEIFVEAVVALGFGQQWENERALDQLGQIRGLVDEAGIRLRGREVEPVAETSLRNLVLQLLPVDSPAEHDQLERVHGCLARHLLHRLEDRRVVTVAEVHRTRDGYPAVFEELRLIQGMVRLVSPVQGGIVATLA